MEWSQNLDRTENGWLTKVAYKYRLRWTSSRVNVPAPLSGEEKDLQIN